jgi:hypothetical protein
MRQNGLGRFSLTGRKFSLIIHVNYTTTSQHLLRFSYNPPVIEVTISIFSLRDARMTARRCVPPRGPSAYTEAGERQVRRGVG